MHANKCLIESDHPLREVLPQQCLLCWIFLLSIGQYQPRMIIKSKLSVSCHPLCKQQEAIWTAQIADVSESNDKVRKTIQVCKLYSFMSMKRELTRALTSAPRDTR